MAFTNQERITKALDIFKEGLRPFIERELHAQYGTTAESTVRSMLADTRLGSGTSDPMQDPAVLLVVMDRTWGEVFRKTLGKAERSLVNEIIDVRNRWAHHTSFSSDDTDRALDSMTRLLSAVSAPQADEIGKMKTELRRVIFDEQMRSERRKSASTSIEGQASGNLRPWREVVNPHKDVASGRYQQAEFAADLWQVHLGEGSEEYRTPEEFFRRTYLTESLKQLLTGAIRRLAGSGGDPVVQLQTNFGGGKTHSMLALYHLFSGTKPSELVGVDALLASEGGAILPTGVKRIVLVGNKISPGNPTIKHDGTVVRTLWGELAWQLGGAQAYQRVKADDENATSPGDLLRELMNEHGPCLILIDEWVSYARQLHDKADLPAGTFDTHFTFAQALTEAAKLAKQCLLVISLPASDTATSPHAQANEEEVGGSRGREALARLQNVIGRVESSWAPASTEEGFEIVRRRLFEPLSEKEQFVARDTAARTFCDLYRTQQQEFPPECRDAEYEKRIKAAYPIHPEIFDRLYSDWSTLVRFQRTRGVLRLMAAVIHSLWERNDRNPLILPAHLPIDDARVRDELTRYLPDSWKPIIEKDVDGPNALPLRIDGEVPNLGKFSAARRVARTVYLGSAPMMSAANRGIEDRRIKLGCVMPGESPTIFGDALRRLSTAATYLYQDGSRYWYSTQPTVTKLAEDRAEQYRRNSDPVAKEISDRLRLDLRIKGSFRRTHDLPQSNADVPDDLEARLVTLGIEHPYSKGPGNKAENAAKAILDMRGSTPRLYRNALVFLAVDETRLQDLDEAVRRYLAWDSILREKDTLNLDPQQTRQAETQRKSAHDTVTAQIPEAYQWLLVPVQKTAQSPIEWQAYRLIGSDPLAARAAKRLQSEELLIPSLAGTRLRMELDKIPLWRGNHVAIKQLIEDFARYPYLPRLSDAQVLIAAVQDGLGLLLWNHESFAYADSFDETSSRYRALRCGPQQNAAIYPNADGLIVRPDIAIKQQATDAAMVPNAVPGLSFMPPTSTTSPAESAPEANGLKSATATSPRSPKRFHGTVVLDPKRVGRDAGRIADEVIAHLEALMGAEVSVTLEIEAKIPSGTPDTVARTVTENSRTLKFTSHGFEEE